MFFGELLEPDIGALGHEDDGGHPSLVGAEGFVFVEGGLIVVAVAALSGAVRAGDVLVFEADVFVADEAFASATGRTVAELVWSGWMEAHPDGEIFFAENVDGEEDAAKILAEVL